VRAQNSSQVVHQGLRDPRLTRATGPLGPPAVSGTRVECRSIDAGGFDAIAAGLYSYDYNPPWRNDGDE
jgi:hypothetical protein